MPKPEKTPDLSREEMVEILKAIARDGSNQAARIAAIKELRAMAGEKRQAKDPFAELDESAGRHLKAV